MNDSVARTLIQILSSSITSLLMFLLFYKLYKPKYHNKTVYIILKIEVLPEAIFLLR